MILETSKSWKHFQARFAEWFNAGIMTMWGVYVILHVGMFEHGPLSPLWTGLLAVATQQTWGMIALVTGLVRLAALYVNGRVHATPSIRLAASFISAFLWTQISLGIWNSGISNPALVLYPALILADIYSAFRAGADATYVARREQVAESRSNGSLAE